MDEYFMRLAIEEARLAFQKGKLPAGAVVVLNDEVIGRGHRLSKLDHAETMALREAFSKVGSARGMTIYTTLEPCIMCFGTIIHLRLERVVFSLEDPYGGRICIRPALEAPRYQIKCPAIVGGILREDVRDLFAEFFRVTENAFWKNPENPLVKSCLGGT